MTNVEDAFVAAVERAAPSVVRVASACARAASGIVMDGNKVVTSSRALGDGERATVAQADERREARVVGRDWTTDVALLAIEGEPLGTAMTFANHESVKVGRLCLALGRPGRSVRASLRIVGVLAGETPLPSGGKLDAYIESDRALPAGFTGGPLVGADGRAIGMNTRAALRGADLAVPHATIARVIAQLEAHGGVPRGYLGVGVQSVRLPASTTGQTRGALVVALDEDGPAAKGGLLIGDVLLSLAGDAVRGPQELAAALFERAATNAEVSLWRGGQPRTIQLVIGTRGGA